MSDLTVPYDPQVMEGREAKLAMAAVAILFGAAVGIVHGVGYATSLRTGTAGMRFRGVAEESVDNSTGSAGDKYIRIRRSGKVLFNQSTLTQSAVGKKAYLSDDNTITLTASGNIYCGDITEIDQQNGKAWVDITNAVRDQGPLYLTQIAAGTALSNSTTETALGSQTIPANRLKAGDRIKIRFQGIATATNSTDTLAIKLYIGGLSGTTLLSLAATDVADNNVFTGEYDLVIRTDGASGTMVGVGVYKSIPAAEGTMTSKDDILASTAIDTTAAQVVAVSGTWSVASASNSVRLDILNVEVLPS